MPTLIILCHITLYAPQYNNLFNEITGNQTDQEYEHAEEVIESEEIGPNQGLVLCDRRPVRSGPHYLVILECRKYSKNKKGYHELVSFFE